MDSKNFNHVPYSSSPMDVCRSQSGRYRLPSPPPSPASDNPGAFSVFEIQTGNDATIPFPNNTTSPPWVLATNSPPLSPPSSPCSPPLSKNSTEFISLPSPASFTSMMFEMDEVSDGGPDELSNFTWPSNIPQTCLLTICNYLSLSDLSAFSRSSRAIYSILSSIHTSILSQRLLHGRHLSADLFAVFLSGQAPYEGLADDPQAFGGRSEVFKKLRGDQRVIDAFVGALVTCVSNARARSEWALGRRVMYADTTAQETVSVWDEGTARVDAVRALLLLWPVVDAIKQASQAVQRIYRQSATEGDSSQMQGLNPHSDEYTAAVCEVARGSLEAFSTETIKLAWYINQHAARQVAIRFQLAGWVAPVYHEGMIGSLLIGGRDHLTHILMQEDNDCVRGCIREFEQRMETYEGYCPLRAALEAELRRRGDEP